MTIRLRVILGFLFTIIVMAAGTLPFMIMTMRDNAEESYISNSSTQLRLMNNYVETFINGALPRLWGFSPTSPIIKKLMFFFAPICL